MKCAILLHTEKNVSVSTYGSFHNITKSSQPIFFLSSYVTISNIAPKMTLDGREKACKMIGCNSEYFWDTAIQTSYFIYCFFDLATKMLV